MAWSAAVRRDVPSQTTSSPRLQLDSLVSSPSPEQDKGGRVSVAVLDANALISFEGSNRLLSLLFSSSPRLVTIKEVLDEVRAPASSFHVTSLLSSVDCMEPCDEALHKVVRFARETGDLQSLSDVDLKLLALTYMLEEQNYGSAHLRTRPPPIHVTQVKHVHERDLPGWGSNVQNLEEWEELAQAHDDLGYEDSHILGLKNLSLSTLEKENVIMVEEQEDVPTQADVAEQKDEAGEEEKELFEDSHELVQEHSEHNVSEEKIGEEKCDMIGPKAEEDGGDWQRAISRSTRRKHDKRALRAALRNPAHVEQNGGSALQDQECEDEIVVNNDEEVTCAEELPSQDKSDGCSLSTSENVDGEEEEPASTCGESEASWTLRPLSQSKVACVTADFPMQNVLLQMGLRVVSPNGLQVHQVQRWALKCEACRNVTPDVGRIFCPKCGNGGTLYKVSIMVGPNGVVHTGTRKRTNIRGTKYSLPLPKSGRQGVAENPILREDQLPQKMLHPKKKASHEDLSSASEIFSMRSGGKEKVQPPVREALAIFSGKRNPNRCRPKQRG